MAKNNIVVYVDQEYLLEYFFYLPKKNLSKNLIFSKQLSNFLTYHDNFFKIAVFQIPFYPDPSWWHKVCTSFANVNHTYIFCDELHPHTVKLIINLDKPNTTFFVNGIINYQFKYANQTVWMYHWKSPSYFYNKVKPEFLQTKLKSGNESLYFDLLNGTRRTHKDFAYNFIKDKGLENKIFLRYQGILTVKNDLDKPSSVWDNEVIDSSKYAPAVIYYGHFMLRSAIIPYSIYNACFYSLITETNASNHFNFYTEKILKPIIARRLFIVIAGKDYLKNLRKLGFCTFSSVIDESYDDEPDDFCRWNKAMEQVLYLTTQDPHKIYSKIKDELIHNQNLMLQSNWDNNISSDIQQDIDCKVEH